MSLTAGAVRVAFRVETEAIGDVSTARPLHLQD